MPQLDTWDVVWKRRLALCDRHDITGRDEHEHRLTVDERADQPSARDPVDARFFSGYPFQRRDAGYSASLRHQPSRARARHCFCPKPTGGSSPAGPRTASRPPCGCSGRRHETRGDPAVAGRYDGTDARALSTVDGTDAAVADPGDIETELAPAGYLRAGMGSGTLGTSGAWAVGGSQAIGVRGQRRFGTCCAREAWSRASPPNSACCSPASTTSRASGQPRRHRLATRGLDHPACQSRRGGQRQQHADVFIGTIVEGPRWTVRPIVELCHERAFADQLGSRWPDPADPRQSFDDRCRLGRRAHQRPRTGPRSARPHRRIRAALRAQTAQPAGPGDRLSHRAGCRRPLHLVQPPESAPGRSVIDPRECVPHRIRPAAGKAESTSWGGSRVGPGTFREPELDAEGGVKNERADPRSALAPSRDENRQWTLTGSRSCWRTVA
jgi:hypothetical protein